MAGQTDALIVGAGPAGSVAALMLARAGLRVRLVDRAVFPRDKLCGDTVNPGSLALLDRLGLGATVRAASVPVTGMLVSGPNDVRVTADYPRALAGAALTRRVLDQILVDAAVSAGVEFDDGVLALRPLVSSKGRVSGITARRRAAEHDVSARIVIAADGRASRLGTALGLSSFAPHPKRWAFGAYFEGVDGSSGRGEMHIRRDGYVGIAPLPGGVVNLCIVRELPGDAGASVVGSARADRIGPAARHPLQEVVENALASDEPLRSRFARARQISRVSVLGPLAVDARDAGCPGLLLAGDAAGFVDPITGDGLSFALRGGLLAATAAIQEIETALPQHRQLAASRRREFASKWRVNRAIRALVSSPRGVLMAATVSRHWDAPVRAIVALAGDVRLAHPPSTAGDTADRPDAA